MVWTLDKEGMKFILLFPLFVYFASETSYCQSYMRVDSKREAERIWELAVAAKGGREKLRSIENVVFFSDGSLKWSNFTGIDPHARV